jgi:hypothetical protein
MAQGAGARRAWSPQLVLVLVEALLLVRACQALNRADAFIGYSEREGGCALCLREPWLLTRLAGH